MRTPTALALLLALACTSPPPPPAAHPVRDNPAAPGFDVEGSDPRAIAVADRTMDALGGRAAWDSTRAISWRFFGRRRHLWDRARGLDRVETEDGTVAVVDVDSGEGRAWRGGRELAGEELAGVLDGARRAWINDAYWLVMPYKLKDSGVTLGWVGETKLPGDRVADVLSLTFEGVGVTPENRYEVAVARVTHLVEQWSFFADAEDAEPRFTTPWSGWERHGAILLSGGRGEIGTLDEIAVHEDLPQGLLETPEPLGSLADEGRGLILND